MEVTILTTPIGNAVLNFGTYSIKQDEKFLNSLKDSLKVKYSDFKIYRYRMNEFLKKVNAFWWLDNNEKVFTSEIIDYLIWNKRKQVENFYPKQKEIIKFFIENYFKNKTKINILLKYNDTDYNSLTPQEKQNAYNELKQTWNM